MMKFDEERLARTLEGLSAQARAVFAAGCAQRLLPSYERYCTESGEGDWSLYNGAMAQLWGDLIGEAKISPASLKGLADECEAGVPEETDPWTQVKGIAQNAAAAVAYALATRLAGESREATWAARQACDAIDTYIGDRVEDLEFGSPEYEQRVNSDPMMQQELREQESDLRDLAESRAVREIMERARRSALSLFV